MTVKNTLREINSERTFACSGWRSEDLTSVVLEMTTEDARKFLEEIEPDLKRLTEANGWMFIEGELCQRGYYSLAVGGNFNRWNSVANKVRNAARSRKLRCQACSQRSPGRWLRKISRLS